MAQKKQIVIEAKDKTKKAFTSANKNVKNLDKSVKGSSESMTKLKTAMKGVIGVLTVGAFVNFTKRQIDAADALGKTADRLGLTTTRLQSLRFAAEQSGMTTEALEMSLQRFTRRTAEAAKGQGMLVNTMKELNIQMHDSAGRTKSVETLLGEVADKMAQTSSQGERVRLAFQMFDSEGVKMVNMLQGGKKGFEALRQELIKTGSFIKEEFIRDSEKANDALNKLSKAAGTAFIEAVSGLAPAITATATALGDLMVIAKKHPVISALAVAVSGLGIAFAFFGGPVTAAITTIGVLIAAGTALNNTLNTQADLANIAGLGISKLEEHHAALTVQLNEVNENLEEGLSFWQKITRQTTEGFEKQKEELEAQIKDIETSIALKKKEAEAEEEKNDIILAGKKEWFKVMGEIQTTETRLFHEGYKAFKEAEEKKRIEIEKTRSLRVASLKEAIAKNNEVSEWQRGRDDEQMYAIQREHDARVEAIETVGAVKGRTLAEQALIEDVENSRLLKAHEDFEEAKKILTMERISGIATQAAQLGNLLHEQGLIGFDAMKAINITEAIINAHLAASKALATLPPPYSYAAAGLSYAMGMARVNAIRSMEVPKKEFGGSVTRGTTYLVGERGAELFTPNQSGAITPNNALGGVTNINFNIRANDAAGFDSLLQQRRGMIVSMISRSLQERGRAGL